MDDAPRSSRAPSVARAAAVLRLLAGEREGLGVTEIARRVELVPSTTLHVLRALLDEGFLHYDQEKKTYRTGDGLRMVVREAMVGNEFAHAVQPVLTELSDEFGVTSIGLEIDNRDRMVVVALAKPDQFISLHLSVGSRFPAFISATGRCFAAASGLSREELRKRFQSLRWQKPPRFEDWYADVLKARKDGVAIDVGNNQQGLKVIATLIPGEPESITRGIAVVGFESQLTERIMKRLATDLKVAAAKVAAPQ